MLLVRVNSVAMPNSSSCRTKENNSLRSAQKQANVLVWLWLSLLIVILDQLTKVWINTHLPFNQPLAVLPFVNLRLLYNTGAAWSILATAGGWQRWFLSGLALVISLLIVVWLSRLTRQQWWLACALALILGGAVGNLVDRIIYGYVIDFIDIYYQGWHWPAFNLADSAISVGAIMLLLEALLSNSQREYTD
ncbi:MAG: lipoprotein signal peptidase [Thioploca sp.]|nr:lipoprotein signal peptidase [Thioploca sp.]